jgi:hypothetical protein
MTKDEILSMAQHCWPSDKRMWSVDADLPRLELFAALVAEKEREACAKACDDLPTPERMSLDNEALWELATLDCAEAIRARGNK